MLQIKQTIEILVFKQGKNKHRLYELVLDGVTRNPITTAKNHIQ